MYTESTSLINWVEIVLFSGFLEKDWTIKSKVEEN